MFSGRADEDPFQAVVHNDLTPPFHSAETSFQKQLFTEKCRGKKNYPTGGDLGCELRMHKHEVISRATALILM